MAWLFLLFSITCMALAFLADSTGLLAICLVGAFVFFILWIIFLYRARFSDLQRDEIMMIDPVELRRLREQIAAKQDQQASRENE